ncbi:MAG: zinc-binding dehydrogenase [Pseudomonadales bacterium]|jgi:(R,R)-butanediol dehydrogenase/meso-butanediol dehydrogenase/diacetyl reductase
MLVGLVTGRERLELKEFPEPTPEPGKAVVQIDYCGICGTDVHAFQSGQPYNPAICGHEWCGTVSAIGPGVNVREGDRVAIGIAGACGRCATCQRGDHEHCETAFSGLIGVGPLAAPHGGFASAIAIDASRLYATHDRIDALDAAMLEPATIALHAVRRTPVRLGDSVVVLGAGPIGLLVMQCARAAGAGATIVVEPNPGRRALAGELGAEALVDPGTESAAERIAAFTGRAGADVVFECAGLPATIEEAVSLSRRGGVVSLVGVPASASEINGAAWLVKEIRLVTSLGYTREEFELSQALVIDGRLRLRPLHTDTITLSQLGEAFTRLANEPQDIKILVQPVG